MDLKAIRSAKGLSQKEVARHLGCSITVYSQYETGARQPSIKTLIKLADYFNVTVDYLIGRREHAMPILLEYEQELIEAARSADEYARQAALYVLRLHIHTPR